MAKKIVKWITYDEASDKPQNGLGGMGGWFGVDKENLTPDGHWGSSHHRWKDYIESFIEDVRPMIEEIHRSILENGIRCTGEEAQNGANAIPLWEDGTVDTYSWRAWGDLMAAVYSTKEDKDYCYMDFYM